ncbi:MAG: cell division protein FtsW [Parachlamydiales bacterium]|nr:cell division protein FtsW [Parachlamydiales bacterium]
MKRYSIIILISVLIIYAMGLIMVFNTTSAEAIDKSLSEIHLPLFRQLLYGIVGVILGTICWKYGYHNLLRISPFLYFFTVFLLLLVFVPGIGLEINGAKRWIKLGMFTWQPSEMAKFIFPLYFIDRFHGKGNPKTFKDFFLLFFPFILPLAFILLEPDNGTVFALFITFIVLCFITRIPWRFWAWPLSVIAVLGGIIASQMPHVPGRIMAFLHPESDLQGRGHQPYQAKIAIGSGKIWGRGLGNSLQKLSYLPEARSDYIAAIYAEEFGFIGICALIALYMVIAVSGFCIAFRVKEKQGKYLSVIITFLLSFQAFLNLGVVSGLLPSKGTILPFFSLGGSGLVVHIVMICVLMNIGFCSSLYSKN